MKKLILILGALVFALPTVLVALLSVYAYYRFPLILPRGFTTSFWTRALLHNPLFVSSFCNSLIIATCNGFFSTSIGMMTARALTRYNFIGKGIINKLYTIPLFIPAIALFLGMHTVMISIGLMNSYAGVILAHMMISLPYAISVFISFFKGINPELEDVAKTLGCRPIDLYRKIIVPLTLPGILLSFSICFLISWTEYFSTFLMGGGRLMTLATLMYPYIHNFDIGHGAVLGVVFIVTNQLVFSIAAYISKKKLKIESYLFE